MAWEFSGECYDCGHHWDVVFVHVGIGPYSEDAYRYFCPQCFQHVDINPALDRLTFRKWLDANRAYVEESRLLQQLVALMVDVIRDSPGLLIPHAAYSASLQCPTCDRALLPGEFNPNACPSCGSKSVLSSDTTHVIIMRVEDPDEDPWFEPFDY